MAFTHPQYLVETDWLADHLNDPDLRILDCSVGIQPAEDEGTGFILTNGRQAWQQGHIPGSRFADLMSELSAPDADFMFKIPTPELFADVMGRYGVGPDSRVVVYDSMMHMWAARVWWMLRAFGFDNAAVLNGGWQKWTHEERPVSTDPSCYPQATFTTHPRPELIAHKDEVFAAVQDGQTCILNALNAEDHNSTVPTRYQRPGRIPSSVNVPAMSMVDPNTHTYLPEEQLRAQFADVGATRSGRVITYCGGGIAASSSAFILTLLGIDQVSLYDGSLTDWTADPDMPMETGPSS
jgi:thiosulfate/3-mercaptopyruvate sulfurtransferase